MKVTLVASTSFTVMENAEQCSFAVDQMEIIGWNMERSISTLTLILDLFILHRPAEFDTDKIYLWLISTGGTTGVLKVAAFKHKPWIDRIQQQKKQFNTDE